MIFTKQSHHRYLEQVWACRKNYFVKRLNYLLDIPHLALLLKWFHFTPKPWAYWFFSSDKFYNFYHWLCPCAGPVTYHCWENMGKPPSFKVFVPTAFKQFFSCWLATSAGFVFLHNLSVGALVHSPLWGQALTHPGTVLDLLPNLLPPHFYSLPFLRASVWFEQVSQ